MEEMVLECPTLVTDMKKKVKDIQMAISWRERYRRERWCRRIQQRRSRADAWCFDRLIQSHSQGCREYLGEAFICVFHDKSVFAHTV